MQQFKHRVGRLLSAQLAKPAADIVKNLYRAGEGRIQFSLKSLFPDESPTWLSGKAIESARALTTSLPSAAPSGVQENVLVEALGGNLRLTVDEKALMIYVCLVLKHNSFCRAWTISPQRAPLDQSLPH